MSKMRGCFPAKANER